MSSYGFEIPAQPMANMPGGWKLDEHGRRIDASEDEDEKTRRIAEALDRIAANERAKETR